MSHFKTYGILGSLVLATSVMCGCGMEDGGWMGPSWYYNANYISAEEKAAMQQNEDEKSDEFEPLAFTNPKNSPQSTFAADVDTASYTLFRYRVNHDIAVTRTDSYSGVYSPYRTEEMVNYFKYDYPAPEGDEVISITTEYARCPWNEKTQLLMIGAQTRKMDSNPASNLVFLVDVSGSMTSDDKLPLLKKSIENFLPTMTERDRVSIVTYADGEKVVLDGANPVSDKNKILKALKSLGASGSTNGERGLEMAYEIAQKHFIENGNNRILMGTDGDLNVGISSEEELKAFVEEKRDQGIYLSILGFGYGNYRDGLLETIADNGNGSYHYIDSELEAERVLIEDRDSTLFVAAKDMKFQVSFNPEKIKGYRLIGYENRVMDAEDFVNDKKDGGEVGVNHQVTVLYEIAEAGADIVIDEYNPEIAPSEMPEFEADESVRLAVRYKLPSGSDASIEKIYPVNMTPVSMSNSMKFASSVAEFSMLLNKSRFAGSGSVQHVKSQLSSIPQAFFDKYKTEFVQLVNKAKFED